MTSHPLDRPIHEALRTRQAMFAQGHGKALRYDPEIAPFLATPDGDDESLADIARLIPEGRPAIMLQKSRDRIPAGTTVDMLADGVQMVAGVLNDPGIEQPIEELEASDDPEMIALAQQTRPGPFLPRTARLGNFIDIRQHGRLVAMAGERFKVPGFTEVSAVCTHPDFRGRGYAAALTAAVAARIAARGETPFLHAFISNTAAIGLYEKLGFAVRARVEVTVLRRL